MNERDFYDRSDRYHRQHQEWGKPASLWRRFLLRHTSDRFERIVGFLETGQDFLELGCGDGSLLSLVVQKYARVHGIEISHTRLEEARKRLSLIGREGKIGSLRSSNLNERLPFEDESFDAVAAISVLEHVFDVYSFLRECRRVLRPDGKLIIEVPNIAYFKHRVRLLFGYLPITSSPFGWAEGFGWDGGHLHYFTKDAVTSLLTGEGFEVRKIVESRAAFADQRSLWVSMLAGNFLIQARKS